MARWLKITLWTVAALVVGFAGFVVWFLWFGPVAISDPAMLLGMITGRHAEAPSKDVVARQLHAPPGFTVSIYAQDLPLARMLRFTSAGDLLVTRSRANEVVLLERDRDGDGRPDGRRVLFANLSRPHGMALHDGWLYVAEDTAIGRVRFDESKGEASGAYQRIVTGLTAQGNHFTKTIGFGPDGMLYLSQGSTCNACIEKDARRATMMRFDADGHGGAIYATGLRNSVGFDWAPWDGALYATENGRDLLGEDVPPEELNRIVAGGDYGWPYVHGFGILDPEFGQDEGKGQESRLRTSLPPAHGFRAHTAPLGIRFLRTAKLPPGYERAALVALHGSWNRRVPDGYEVVSLHWDEQGRITEKPFLTGFRGESGVIGRPVDVAEGPDGAVYVSDDYAGVVYRVVWQDGAAAH